MTDILCIKNICKQYPEFELKDISLSLPLGYIMGLVGLNGAGKTTLIKAIMNGVVLQKGDIEVFGLPLHPNEAAIKNRIGYVSDESIFCREWTCHYTGKVMRALYDSWDQQKFDGYLKAWKLNGGKRVKALSRGQQMQLSLAAALSHETDLLILDEPTSGLDPYMRTVFVEEFQKYIENETKSVLFSTHIVADLEKCADFITFIHSGHIVFSKRRDDIAEDYMIIKGGRDVLTPEVKRELIGCRLYDYGFEGLMNIANINVLPPSCEATPAGIEEIMVLFHDISIKDSRKEAGR